MSCRPPLAAHTDNFMATPPLFALPDNSCVKVVHSLHELVATPFTGNINALCWPRTLPGNFGEVIEHLGSGEGIVPVDESELQDLPLSDAGKIARDTLLEDQRLLRAFRSQLGYCPATMATFTLPVVATV